MKFTAYLALLSALSGVASAQNQFAVEVEPLPALLTFYNITGHYRLDPNLSLGASLHYNPLGLFDDDKEQIDFSFYGLGGRVDYHFAGTYRSGFYVTGMAKLLRLEAVKSFDDQCIDVTYAANGFSLSGYGGYQWHGETLYNRLGAGVLAVGLATLSGGASCSLVGYEPGVPIFIPPIPVPYAYWSLGVVF